LVAHSLVNTFASFPLPAALQWRSREFVTMMAVGVDADPAIGAFVYDLFAATSPVGRGGCAKMLVDAMGRRHISLIGLTVPTLVIGSKRDRLTPISQSRRIARDVPNLMGFVELAGGHCAMLEQPRKVNSALRSLAESVARGCWARRISS
jgi:pimeloyl-ACP methyl ester carboxylesterase